MVIVTEKKDAIQSKITDFYQYTADPKTVARITAIEQLKNLPAAISFPITSPEPKLLSWLNHSRSIIDIAHVRRVTAGEAYEIQPMVLLATIRLEQYRQAQAGQYGNHRPLCFLGIKKESHTLIQECLSASRRRRLKKFPKIHTSDE